jgi:two-component system cell cycle sensor histidine kinase/response regulator CckA
MKDANKTKEQLLADLTLLRERIAALEGSRDFNVVFGESFRETEMRYKFISENVGDFIWQLDSSLCFIYVSPSVKKIGLQPEEMIGKSLFSFLTPQGAATTRDLYARRQALAESRIPEDKTMVELDFVLKDGSLLPVEVRISPSFDGDGNLVSFQGVTRDITERKLAQEEKTRLESQLLQAQKMEAIGQLAGGIAHDFNNTLMVIMGFASIMKAHMNQNDPMRKYVSQILSSSEKAAGLTRSLLAFSRKQQMSVIPVDVNDMVRDTGEFLERLLTKDIQLKMRLSDGPCVVAADVTQMNQVLINLATNARDAMPDGGMLTIATRIEKLDDVFTVSQGLGAPGEYAMLTVSDTGVGMDGRTKEHMFEPFFTTKEAGKGTGLGLSTVYGVVRQHGGCITVDSTPGNGTTFYIFLPLVAEREQTASPLEEARKGKGVVLIAEDDQSARKLAAEILQSDGLTVLEAIDGDDAVRKYIANKDKVDLVVLDVIMPGKNGAEAYEEIKEVNPGVQVIFVSGYLEESTIGAIQGRTAHFVSKPLSSQIFLAKVREVLGR